MSATLVDLAQTSEDPLLVGVVEMFLQYWNPLMVIPYETIGDLVVKSVRWSTLPTVGYRALNGSYSESTGTFEQQEESLSIIGGDIDVDVQFKGNKSAMIDMMGEQSRMKTKAMSYKVGNDFINGDRATDPLEVDGLAVRLGNLAARQTVSASGTTDSLKVYNSASTLNSFFDALTQGMFALDGGVCNALFADETTIQGIYSAIRRLSVPVRQGEALEFIMGGVKLHIPTLEINGQSIPMFNAGYTDELQTTKVITTTEDPGDGGTDSTTIYLVRWEGERQFSGLQKANLETRPLGELQASPQERVRIEWVMGYANWNDRSLVRINDMKFAAS